MTKKSGKITIRFAIPEDARGIAKVHVDVWRSRYKGIVPGDFLDNLSYEKRESNWKKILEKQDRDSMDFVATDEIGQIVGFSTVGPGRDKDIEFDGELWAIYLEDRFQGQGIGRDLFLASANWLKQKGYNSMYVWVLTENPTVNFYKKMGGKLISKKQIEIGKMLDEVSLGWSLSVLFKSSFLNF